MFSLDASGKLKIESKKADVSADTSTDILLQFAVQRRGLSMDQANLLEYNIHQKWVDCVIKMRLTPAPHVYQMTSFRQILDADKKLLEELCDATLQVTAEGRPLDKCFVERMNRSEVVHLLQPLPSKHVDNVIQDKLVPDRPSPYPVPGVKGKGKGKTKGKGKDNAKMPWSSYKCW